MPKNRAVLSTSFRFLTVVLLPIVCYSCKPGIPKDIIQPPAMENIIYDIHVVDGYASVAALPTLDSTKKVIAPVYKGVYKKYGIDSALYAKSMDYYYQHPQLLKEMYERIVAKLSKEKDKAAKTPAAQSFAPPVPTPQVSDAPPVKDSLISPPKAEVVPIQSVQ